MTVISVAAAVLVCSFTSFVIGETSPSIRNNRTIYSISNGGVIKISCEAQGDPKPTIRWEVDGNRVTEEVSSGKPAGEFHFLVSENESLTIINSQSSKRDGPMNVTCIANSTAGIAQRTFQVIFVKVKSYSFQVFLPKERLPNLMKTVELKVREVFQPGKLYYSFNITLINMTSGAVDFELTWKEKNLRKHYGDPIEVRKLADDVLRAMKEGSFRPMRFQMNAPPPPPVDLTADDVQSDKVTISWKRPEYFEVDFYQIQVSAGSSNKWRNFSSVDGGKESATLGNLESETKYLIRIECGNRHGVGETKSDVLQVETKEKTQVLIIVVVVVCIVFAILVLVLGVVYYRRRKRQPTERPLIFEENPYQHSIPGVSTGKIYLRENRTFCPTDIFDSATNQGYVSWKEIPRNCLTMGDILGYGEFGLVVKAVWRDELSNRDMTVAVKTVKDIATETDRKELFKELRLMADVAEHPNIVNLIGACSRGGPLLIVVEFCECGDLLRYLKKNRKEMSAVEGTFVSSLDTLTRVRIAYDVSKGMCFLEGKKIVHRDLAARNVLLGRNRIAKVSDFGLSRDIYEAGLYEKKTSGKLPTKWMAIESLQDMIFTTKSDVWSFGVLFWEIETAGVVPYPGVSGSDLLGYLQRGCRLPKPSETAPEIYEIMETCWETSPSARPLFKDLESKLESYLQKHSVYLPVVIDEDDAPGAVNAD